MGIVTASYGLEWKPSGSWVAIADSAVVEISGGGAAGLSDAGAGFGDAAPHSASVSVLRSAVATYSGAWQRVPIRFDYTIGASSARAFVGVIRGWRETPETVEFTCSSLLEDLPPRTRDYYSPIRYRRPPATKTTASSIEDPDDGGYAGGLINELLWRAGLRPYQQSGSYPAADGYYSCEQAIRAPDWSWIAGEDGWAEALRLARAVGGQLYQRTDGVVCYRQPLTMVGSVVRTFTPDDYESIEVEGRTESYATAISCAFTPRRPQPTQRVIEDTTYRTVGPSDSLTIDLEPRWPLASAVLDDGTLKSNNITATYFDGRLAAYDGATGYTVVTTVKAMRLTIVVTNHASLPLQISKIVLDGRPIAAGETGTVQVGGGTPARTLEDNVFVQSEPHARALDTMALTFYGVLRPTRALRTCVYDPDLAIGDTVLLTEPLLDLEDAPHLVLEVRHQDTGMTADYVLLDADGLPALADYWLVLSTPQSGTKLIAW